MVVHHLTDLLSDHALVPTKLRLPVACNCPGFPNLVEASLAWNRDTANAIAIMTMMMKLVDRAGFEPATLRDLA